MQSWLIKKPKSNDKNEASATTKNQSEPASSKSSDKTQNEDIGVSESSSNDRNEAAAFSGKPDDNIPGNSNENPSAESSKQSKRLKL